MKRKVAYFLLFAFLVCSIQMTTHAETVEAAKKPKLNIKKLELTIGNTFCLRVRNMKKKKQQVVFSSSRPRVVKIDTQSTEPRSAMIQACKKGKSVITATIYRGDRVIRKLNCQVTVTPNGVSIKFAKKKYTVNLAQNEKLRLHTMVKPNNSTEQPIFESSNPEVATVSFDGMITAITTGTTTITATLLSTDQKITCKVIVIYEEEPETGIRNNKQERQIRKIQKASIQHDEVLE